MLIQGAHEFAFFSTHGVNCTGDSQNTWKGSNICICTYQKLLRQLEDQVTACFETCKSVSSKHTTDGAYGSNCITLMTHAVDLVREKPTFYWCLNGKETLFNSPSKTMLDPKLMF